MTKDNEQLTQLNDFVFRAIDYEFVAINPIGYSYFVFSYSLALMMPQLMALLLVKFLHLNSRS
jgi:hypothetical protein